MRHPTDQLKKLRKAISDAGRIVRGVPLAASEKPHHHLKVQSFILLTHAAIEEYLEDLDRSVAREARRRLHKEGRISRTLVALVCAKIIDDVKEKGKRRVGEDLVADLDSFSEAALNRYEGTLRGNHGIRTANLKDILLPVGVDPERVDTQAMSTIDAFGSARGGLAHKFTMIRTEHSKGEVQTTLKLILDGTKQFDQAACAALKLCMKMALF